MTIKAERMDDRLPTMAIQYRSEKKEGNMEEGIKISSMRRH